MIETHGLSHVALAVADPDRSLAFYAAAFGVREYCRDVDRDGYEIEIWFE